MTACDDPRGPHRLETESSQEASQENVRWSQYAENRPNPLPELAVDPEAAPEPVSNLEELKAPGDTNPFAGVPVTRPPGLVQPDGGDPRSSAIVFNEPEQSWITKHKSWIIAAFTVVVMILIATVVGIVVKNHDANSGGGDKSSTTSTPMAGSTPVQLSTSTSTSAPTSTSSSTPTECTDTDFKTNASFMSITGVTGGWTSSFAATSDAVGCCTYCYHSVPSGCNGWMWVPNDDGSTSGTSCVLISGWAGTNSDSSCPSGHTSVSILTQASNASHVGGAGPCGTVS